MYRYYAATEGFIAQPRIDVPGHPHKGAGLVWRRGGPQTQSRPDVTAPKLTTGAALERHPG